MTDGMDARSRLIAAMEQLCTESDPGFVTIRQIGEVADVSPGLIYHYFHSKDGLLGAMLSAIARDLDELVSTADSPETMAKLALGFTLERPAFPRAVASMVLRDVDITAAMGEHPFLRRLGAAMGVSEPTAQSHAGATAVVILGAGLYIPAVNRALGRSPSDPDVSAAISRLISLASA
jgi:AcrR family transcriptional regulator